MKAKPLGRTVRGIVVAWWVVGAASVGAQTNQAGSGMEELRREVEAMRAAYESRVRSLESRLVSLEQDNAALRARQLGTNATSVADLAALQVRVNQLEAEQERARGERAANRETAGLALRDAAVAQELAKRARAGATETRAIFRDQGGWFLDPNQLYQLPRRFEFHGYLRSGFGMSGKQGEMVAFQAPGAGAKYRLGNEAETYGEFELVHNWLNEADPLKKPYVRMPIMLSFKTGQNASYESVNDTDLNNDFAVRQAYVEGGNVFPEHPDIRFWGGQRYYRRHDLHINDFYYLDMSGYGAGVEDVPLGRSVKLALAWLGGTYDRLQTDNGSLTKQNVDLRLYGMKLPTGNLTLWLNWASTRGGQVPNVYEPDGDPALLPSAQGWAAGVIHRTEFTPDDYNEVSVQFGRGAAFNFSTSLDRASPDIDEAERLLITEQLTIQPVKWFSVQGVFVYQRTDYGGTGDDRETWVSAGARPVFHFNDRFSVAVEGGYDWVDSGPMNQSDKLWKITLAPQLSRGGKFFSRPVLRAYVTYAKWGDEFRGQVGGPAYNFSTDGLNFGVQVESWW